MTYRFKGHVGAYDATEDQHIKDIRPPQELDKWLKRDPLTILQTHAAKNGIFKSQAQFQNIIKAAQKEARNAYNHALQSPYPNQRELTNYVFS
jgi:TPP-dependent pyruvate/acetoin dehydrogenase alpha subunit